MKKIISLSLLLFLGVSSIALSLNVIHGRGFTKGPQVIYPTIQYLFSNETECTNGFYADTGITASYYGTGETVSVTPMWYSAGPVNGAVLFDGVNDFIYSKGWGNAPGHFATDSNFSFTVWAITLTTHGYETFGKIDTSDDGPAFGISTNRIFLKHYRNYSDKYISAIVTTGITDGVWHHYAFVHEGAFPASNVKGWVYIDGVLAGAVTNNTLDNGAYEGTGNSYLKLADWHDTPGRYFKGGISDYRLFDSTALSPDNVYQIYLEKITNHESGTQAWSDPSTNASVFLLDFQRNWNEVILERLSNVVVTRKPSGSTGPSVGLNGINANGRIDQHMNFDGIDDYLQAPSSSLYDFQTNFTLMAWVRPDESNKVGSICGKWYDGTNAAWQWTLGSDKTNWGMYFQMRDGGSDYYVSEHESGTPYVHPFHEWTHIAITKSNTTWNMYVNGVVVSNRVWDHTPNINVASMTIGKAGHPSIADYNIYPGDIDELQIANYAMSSTMIYNDFNKTFLTNNLRWP